MRAGPEPRSIGEGTPAVGQFGWSHDRGSCPKRCPQGEPQCLIPFLVLCYAVNFLDRVNVGFAGLAMNEDLGFTPEVFGFGAGIFFVGYILFEIPSNLALAQIRRAHLDRAHHDQLGPGRDRHGFRQRRDELLWLRFLLGVAEAGFFPGIILYLTYWFPARGARAHRVPVHDGGSPRHGDRRARSPALLLGLHGVTV